MINRRRNTFVRGIAIASSCIWNCLLESLQELFGTDARTAIHRKLQLANLLVDLLHKVYDKINEFMFIHLFSVKVGDEKRDVVALNRFPSQDEEALGTHHHEAGELVTENLLNLIGLLDCDADTHRIHRCFD